MTAPAEMHYAVHASPSLAELSSVNVCYLPGCVAPQIAQFARGPETVVSSSLLVNPGLRVTCVQFSWQPDLIALIDTQRQ